MFSGVYSVELVNDSLYEWNVKLLIVDSDSPLHSDLMQLKEQDGTDYILLNFHFKVNIFFIVINIVVTLKRILSIEFCLILNLNSQNETFNISCTPILILGIILKYGLG